MRRAVVVALVLIALVGGAWWWRQSRGVLPPAVASARSTAATTHPPARRDKRLGGTDVTFLVASDTHFGFGSSERDLLGALHDPVKDPKGTEAVNARAIRDMNRMPGRPWPQRLGGTIERPRGLLITGDLTENGDPWQWRYFVQYYGLNGDDGLVHYPVFEAFGNHDKHHSWYVLDRVRERHGGMRYAFDWDDVHLVCLGEAPDDAGLRWLAKDLSAVGGERPVILYFHFPLRGPFSDDNWFGRGDYRERLARALEGHNVIAIFHGHYHASGRYRWAGHDIYNVGAAKHLRHSFAVVRVSDARLRVASWHYGLHEFQWWHEKPINGAPGKEISGGTRMDGGMLLDPP
ncbi:MAG: metallophosphoesterase [Myxococcales bacterium]|nr:metallophosphoesterase [Myxococcales bacterium]MCB9578159.1 metallophosphoesterase [Polyangiaceae bacterium]